MASKVSTKEAERKKRSVEPERVREKEKERERESRERERPRPSTESIVVEARTSATTKEARVDRAPRDRDDAQRRRDRPREEERRSKPRVDSPMRDAIVRSERPTASASSQSTTAPAAAPKPTGSSALVASILAAIDDTPPAVALAPKSPNKARRPASPLAGRSLTTTTKDRTEVKKHRVEIVKSSMPKSSSGGNLASSRPTGHLRTSTKENAVLKGSDTLSKKRVISTSSADPFGRRAVLPTSTRERERMRA